MSRFSVHIIFLFVIGIFCITSFSQVPGKMSYQAVIRDDRGALVVNHPVGIRISILKSDDPASAVFMETHSAETNENGMITVEIGGGTILLGSLESIDWANGPYFLQMESDPAGGTGFRLNTISPMPGVPYALYARTAEKFTGTFTETDPVFDSSVAKGLTARDTAYWNSKLEKFDETDPIYRASAAKNIMAADTARWNHKVGSESQDLSDVLAMGNDGKGKYIRNISNPTAPEDAVTKAYADVLKKLLVTLENTVKAGGAVTDADGNGYNTVKIGTQVWMADNLRTTRYSDSTAIPKGNALTWGSSPTPAYAWYNMDSARYFIPYGALYNGYAVSTGKLCPVGWHVPENDEWNTLVSFLWGYDIAGGNMKEAGTDHWFSPNIGGTNQGGFSALPGGSYPSPSRDPGRDCNFWSFTETTPGYNGSRNLNYSSSACSYIDCGKSAGFSVRCLKDTGYGPVKIPELLTKEAEAITQTSAASGATILSDGGASITAKGVCWSTTHNPDINGNKTTDGNGRSGFTSRINFLEDNTTYYVRAYALNSAGLAYGNEISFSTLKGVIVLTTTDVSAITVTSAATGGVITTDGGLAVTSRGVCFDTLPNPLITGLFTLDGAGTGSFTSILRDLSEGTVYYVRAYATNSDGTVYGNQRSFITVTTPRVVTTAASDIKGISARAGGTISSTGGSSITAQGLCWSTDPAPTTANSITSSFTAELTGLTPNTVYFVRAYAVNMAGTSYGNEISFNSGYTIGTAYAGGLIFYNDGTGHGIVSAESDQSAQASWGYIGIFIGGTSVEIGTGAANTMAILARYVKQGSSPDICNNLDISGFNDWYLPSLNELALMFKNLHVKGLGGFIEGGYYWSSSELYPNDAWTYYFQYGGAAQEYAKPADFRVRAARTF